MTRTIGMPDWARLHFGLTTPCWLCFAWDVTERKEGPASQLDEPQPSPQPAGLQSAGIVKKIEPTIKVDIDPIDNFVPSLSPSQIKEYATETGASILVAIYRRERMERERAELGREDALRKLDDMRTGYHRLELTLTAQIHEVRVTLTQECHDLRVRHATVADRLRHMRRESWVVPVLTLFSGVLLSAFWKMKEGDPGRAYLLFGGLGLAAIAVVMLFLRGFRKPKDEGQ